MWNSLWNTHWVDAQPVFNEFRFGGPIWALKAGYRLGFVGVSDDHFIGEHISLLGSALTACNVGYLSREEVLHALRNRRCYAFCFAGNEPVRVPVRDDRRTNWPAERQLITRLESDGSVDRDSLTLVCVGKGKNY